jgi:hypothetical protein
MQENGTVPSYREDGGLSEHFLVTLLIHGGWSLVKSIRVALEICEKRVIPAPVCSILGDLPLSSLV